MPCMGGKVLLKLDTQRGFGAGQRELLSWEVTVVAALCLMSSLATFPTGGWHSGLEGSRSWAHGQEVTLDAHRDARNRQRGLACGKAPVLAQE